MNKRTLIEIFGLISIIGSLIFVGIESSGVPWFVFLSYISFGGICYGLRYLYLRRIGINIKELRTSDVGLFKQRLGILAFIGKVKCSVEQLDRLTGFDPLGQISGGDKRGCHET